jgi:hypothetical protein
MDVSGPMIEQTDTEKPYDPMLSYAGHKNKLFSRKKIA